VFDTVSWLTARTSGLSHLSTKISSRPTGVRKPGEKVTSWRAFTWNGNTSKSRFSTPTRT